MNTLFEWKIISREKHFIKVILSSVIVDEDNKKLELISRDILVYYSERTNS